MNGTLVSTTSLDLGVMAKKGYSGERETFRSEVSPFVWQIYLSYCKYDATNNRGLEYLIPYKNF